MVPDTDADVVIQPLTAVAMMYGASCYKVRHKSNSEPAKIMVFVVEGTVTFHADSPAEHPTRDMTAIINCAAMALRERCGHGN